MKSLILAASLIVLLFFGCTQARRDKNVPVDLITVDELRQDVSYLASDQLKGRFYSSEGYELAAKYAVSKFEKAGLKTIMVDDSIKTYFQQASLEKIEFKSIVLKSGAIGVIGLKNNTMQVKSSNVIAVVTGTDVVLKNEYITVGAHLDHLGVLNDSIYNGADDNASGSAAVLEIADAVAHSKPKRSVIFILYTAEEEGLLGSRYFINNPPVPVKNIKFNLNLDMIGRPAGEANDLFIVSAGKISQKYKKLLQAINNKTEKIVLDTIDKKNFSKRSDQASFYPKGIPNLFFSTGVHIDYHKPSDDPAKIDYNFLRCVSRLSYDLVMELADEQLPDSGELKN
jgi:Zn-dependent M28 family amino/carboxypeptidase